MGQATSEPSASLRRQDSPRTWEMLCMLESGHGQHKEIASGETEKVRPLQPKAPTAETRRRGATVREGAAPAGPPCRCAGRKPVCTHACCWGSPEGRRRGSAAWKPSRQTSLLHSHLQDAERPDTLQTELLPGEPEGLTLCFDVFKVFVLKRKRKQIS